MSIGFDPIVSSVLFSASLVPHAARPRARLELPSDEGTGRPFVTVIVALYRERWDDVEMTIASLIRQTYRREHFEVLLAIEARDPDMRPCAEMGISRLRAAAAAVEPRVLTCLARLLRSTLPWKRKCVMALPFLTPLSCSLAFIGWMLILGQWAISAATGIALPQATLSLVSHPAYATAMSYWAVLLFRAGIPLCVASYVLGTSRPARVRLPPF